MNSAGAVIVAKQNRYMRRFQEAGAISAETAVDLMQIHCRASGLFRRMVARGVFLSTASGKYYIDLDAAIQFRNDRKRRALIALAIALTVFVLMAAYFYSTNAWTLPF